LSETATYWICDCGKAIDKSARRCSSCGHRRKVRWVIPILIFGGIAGLAVLAQSHSTSKTDSSIKEDGPQANFDRQVLKWAGEIGDQPNEVAVIDAAARRDKDLFAAFAHVRNLTDWTGTVSGIANMTGGGGLSVDIGSAHLVAGVHYGKGIDTLIKPEDPLFRTLLTLSNGDKIKFSGAFPPNTENSLATVDYRGTLSPDFLFRFSQLKKVN
jgi:hypothetical protein